VDADLVVGADGLHSATRALVLGPEQDHRLDLNRMVGVYLMDRRPDVVAEGTTATLTVTGRTLAVISLGHDRAAAFFGYRTDDPARNLAEPPEGDPPRPRGHGLAALDTLVQLRTAEPVHFDTISQIVMDRWSRGRVVLLGDATWCVTRFAGYGSSLAVGGAELLGTMLQRHPDDTTAALAAWEAQLRPEAERKQMLGRRVKGLYAPADPLRLWLRDLPLRMAALPPMGRLLQRRLQLRG
jgi:2-polyprenyl-6-methoxyphenol hydroxylase-like FAD-dependent oxidoreductase